MVVGGHGVDCDVAAVAVGAGVVVDVGAVVAVVVDIVVDVVCGVVVARCC